MNSSVIQGCFPNGFRPPVPPRPAPMPPPVAQRATMPRGGVFPPPRPVVPQQQQNQPVIQRFGAGTAMRLPDAMASAASRSIGQPLQPAVRQMMESLFGTSFADVRVHVGPHVSAIGATSYTQGSNVHFAPGQYAPEHGVGRQRLAYELAHVVQQRAGRVVNPYAPHAALVQDRALDAEADRMATRVVTPRAPVQRKTGSTIQLLKMSQAVAGLNIEERALLERWLVARSPGQGVDVRDTDALARGLLVHRIATVDELRATLNLFDRHMTRAAAHDAAYETSAVDNLFNHLRGSRILSTYPMMGLTRAGIRMSLRFLDDAAFAQAHYAEQLSINPQFDPTNVAYQAGTNWNFRVSSASKATPTLAFEHGGTIRLRAGDASMHIAVHELIHKMAAADAITLGPILNEGFTEKIAILVCAERAIALEDDFYARHRAAVDAFLRLYNLTAEADWMEVYFQRPARLLDLIRADLGAGGLATLVRNKDAAQSIAVFNQQREVEQQRKVRAGLLLETTPGRYVVIPPALGTGGQTLEARVREALRLYDAATKFKQSTQTTNAITVLRGLLPNHPHLYAAVRWYLRQNIQQPQTVVVGAKLTAGSRFDGLLSAAYNAWL